MKKKILKKVGNEKQWLCICLRNEEEKKNALNFKNVRLDINEGERSVKWCEVSEKTNNEEKKGKKGPTIRNVHFVPREIPAPRAVL